VASSSSNKAFVGRAAAALTAAEVAGNAFDLNNAWASQVTVDLTFTLGAIVNCTVRMYASTDGVTYDPIYDAAGNQFTEVLTADAERCYTVPNLNGWKFFRVSVQGNAPGGSCAFDYRYLRRGSQ